MGIHNLRDWTYDAASNVPVSRPMVDALIKLAPELPACVAPKTMIVTAKATHVPKLPSTIQNTIA